VFRVLQGGCKFAGVVNVFTGHFMIDVFDFLPDVVNSGKIVNVTSVSRLALFEVLQGWW
jgi:hypothetical protein